jgi:hypothetical protein
VGGVGEEGPGVGLRGAYVIRFHFCSDFDMHTLSFLSLSDCKTRPSTCLIASSSLVASLDSVR